MRNDYQSLVFSFLISISLMSPLSLQAATLTQLIPVNTAVSNISLSNNMTDSEEQTSKIISLSGKVKNSKKQAVSGAKVLFTDRTASSSQMTTNTDNNGDFRVQLGNGEWLGCACGSHAGYQPLFWQVSVYNDEITSYNELHYVSPEINTIAVYPPNMNINATIAITPATVAMDTIPSNAQVIVTGDWFGCSGKVLLEMADKQVEITEFSVQQNNRLEFFMPDLMKLGIKNATSFRLSYVTGTSRSPLVAWNIPFRQSATLNDGPKTLNTGTTKNSSKTTIGTTSSIKKPKK